jgi:hypothetical protein
MKVPAGPPSVQEGETAAPAPILRETAKETFYLWGPVPPPPPPRPPSPGPRPRPHPLSMGVQRHNQVSIIIGGRSPQGNIYPLAHAESTACPHPRWACLERIAPAPAPDSGAGASLVAEHTQQHVIIPLRSREFVSMTKAKSPQLRHQVTRPEADLTCSDSASDVL